MSQWFEMEDRWLAPYAMRGSQSRGRAHPEPEHSFRTVFQRDRERIIHCTAFRRLMGKTQVLVGQINDHHRTRLTHTLEVVQISRTIARRMRLNEDLTEAIALSHDLGHPPFGHVGERALAALMQNHGSFEHNLFGLRRVDFLEDRYPEFPGLNLSWELREAFVQHCKNRQAPECQPFLADGGPLLEAQLADTADSLAYDTHDIDDALGTDLITLHDLREVEIWRRGSEAVHRQYSDLSADSFRTAVIRELIAWQVSDLIDESERRLAERQIGSIADVRACPDTLIQASAELLAMKSELEKFLRDRVYHHHRVLRMAKRGQRILGELFAEFVINPELLPPHHLRRWINAPQRVVRDRPRKLLIDSLERVVCDYLAGMTDRFAKLEHARLFQDAGD